MKKKEITRIIKTDGHKRVDRRRFVLFSIFAFVLTATLSFLATSSMEKTVATDFSQFKAGNIISDAVMRNYTSMTEAEIQTFLDKHVSCNRAASGGQSVNAGTSYGVKYNYKATYGGSTYYYHVENGKFVCMNTEKFNGETAAHIIYSVAQQYKINPQVLIVLLEKEQGLVSDNWPNSNFQYRSATGFGCPDTAPCASEYYGLKNQLENAAWLFDQVLSGGWTNYDVGNNWIRYSPNASCGGSWVNIENKATASLYRYTPYQPNAAAIKNYPGGATCGAYGNRNFYAFFTNWFGSTQKVQYTFAQNYYNQNKAKTGALKGENICKTTSGKEADLLEDGSYNCYHDYEKGTLFWDVEVKSAVKTESNPVFYNTTTSELYKSLTKEQKTELGAIKDSDVSVSTENNEKYYTIIVGDIYYKYKNGELEKIDDPIMKALQDNKDIVGGATESATVYANDNNLRIMKCEKGVILGNDDKGYYGLTQAAFVGWEKNREFLGYPISNRHINPSNYEKTKFEWQDFEHALMMGNSESGWYVGYGKLLVAWQRNGYETGPLGFPTSDIQHNGEYTWQNFKKGLVMGTDKTGYYYAYGKSLVAWQKTGYEHGALKYPLSDLVCDNKTKLCQQKYQGGYIVGNDSHGYYDSRGSIRTKWLNSGGVNGRYGWPKGFISGGKQLYSGGYIYQ